MTYQRAALPSRTDLTSRRKQVAAWAMLRCLDLVDGVMSRMVVRVTPPADDPFYAVGQSLEAVRPGTVLDARSIAVRGIRRVIDVDAWHVKFCSTESSGAATSGVTTVMIPRRHSECASRPLLSYQCAIDSLGDANDPSYTLTQGNQKELPVMVRALRRGWAVVTTDYTGPHHAFGAGLVTPHFVLDGIRAALAFEPAGFEAAPPIGLWGYSGGAFATIRAVEEQPTYAPELNIVGAVGGGLPVDMTSSTPIFEDGSVYSGMAVANCIGASREYPDVHLSDVLTPKGQVLMSAAADMTVEELVLSFPFLRWSDYLTVQGVLEVPGLRTALQATRLGQSTPATTMYLYHAVHDEVLDIGDVDKLAEKYRREGVGVTYRRFRFGEHVIVALTGVPSSLRFLGERFGDPRTRRARRGRAGPG